MHAVTRRLWSHPIVRGMLAVTVFVVVAEVLVLFVLPAWAEVSIPITSHTTINLGDLPQWIIALVAAGGLWKAWQAEQRAREAAAKAEEAITTAAVAARHAAAGVVVMKEVSHQINGLLADRDRGKVAEGEKIGEQAGEAKAATLAEGQRQGREEERAAGAVQHPVPSTDATKAPLPVEDDRTALAGERVAVETERVASATEDKAGG